jgi:hypothetical protein
MPRRTPAARLALPAALAALAACAGSRPPAASADAPRAAVGEAPRAPGRPLASLAGERVAVVPVQRVRISDSAMAAGAPAVAAAAYLRGLDSALADAARDRSGSWAFASDVARSARRNPTYAPDAYRLSVGPLLPGRRQTPDNALPDPLASQLRTIVALNDARYVVVPSELRVEAAGAGTARAVLHLALVDARAAQLRWSGDVAADAAPVSSSPLSSTAAAALAARFADLIAAP